MAVAARHRAARRYPGATITTEHVAQATRSLKMKFDSADAAQLTLRVSMNIWSFGEIVTVVLGDVDGCALVDITSRCKMPTQIADWGKNERNVSRVFEALDRTLGESVAHERCLICPDCNFLLAAESAQACPECGRSLNAEDKPSETATLITAIKLTALITMIELALIFGASYLFGFRLPLPFTWWYLLLINTVGILVVLVLHYLVKRFLQRRSAKTPNSDSNAP